LGGDAVATLFFEVFTGFAGDRAPPSLAAFLFSVKPLASRFLAISVGGLSEHREDEFEVCHVVTEVILGVGERNRDLEIATATGTIFSEDSPRLSRFLNRGSSPSIAFGLHKS